MAQNQSDENNINGGNMETLRVMDEVTVTNVLPVASMEVQNSPQFVDFNENELFSSDYPFTGQELRDILLNVLKIRCSYPLFPSQSYGSTIRCILELNEELDQQQIGDLKKFETGVVIEDVICKVIPKLSSRRISDKKNLMLSFPLKKPLVRFSFHPPPL
jgi:hypothetical protein